MKRSLNIHSWIKNLLTLDNLIILGLLSLKWILIISTIGIFILCSMMIGNFIDHNIWIVLASDLAFCWLFWMFLGLSKYVSYGSSLSLKHMRTGVILGIAMVVMFILIAMATLGVAINNTIVLLNIYLFPIMVAITFAIYLYDRRKST